MIKFNPKFSAQINSQLVQGVKNISLFTFLILQIPLKGAPLESENAKAKVQLTLLCLPSTQCTMVVKNWTRKFIYLLLSNSLDFLMWALLLLCRSKFCFPLISLWQISQWNLFFNVSGNFLTTCGCILKNISSSKSSRFGVSPEFSGTSTTGKRNKDLVWWVK